MRRTRPTCLLCEQLASRNVAQQRRFASAPSSATVTTSFRQRAQDLPPRLQLRPRRSATTLVSDGVRNGSGAPPPIAAKSRPKTTAKESSDTLQYAKELVSAILSTRDYVPTEKEVLQAMEACQRAARQLTSYDISVEDSDPASALLLLSGRKTADAKSHHPASLAISIDLLSNLAYKTLLHPTVFITPEILETYVLTQATLQRPESFPDVFRLYATKQRPKPNSKPIAFTTPDPNSHTAAIPAVTAKVAIEAAITAKDMDLALRIINTSFRTLAWRRNKFMTRAFVPLSGLSLAPVGLYVLASQLALVPSAADPTSMTLAIFGGAMTYVSVVASMGFIALSTANDQMKRVTWAQGTPLRERWVREEERAAMDAVVCGFGFQQKNKWGDESGPQWEMLRDWIGVRGCVVDKVELMEGME